jgi:hypothetical protein
MPGIILSGMPEPETSGGKAGALAAGAALAASAAGVPGKGLPHWAWATLVVVDSVTAQSAH